MSNVIIFSKPNCIHCNFTKRFLEEHNVNYETRNIEEDEQALQEVKDLGFSSLPVVLAENIEPFTGFHPEKLSQLIANF